MASLATKSRWFSPYYNTASMERLQEKKERLFTFHARCVLRFAACAKRKQPLCWRFVACAKRKQPLCRPRYLLIPPFKASVKSLRPEAAAVEGDARPLQG